MFVDPFIKGQMLKAKLYMKVIKRKLMVAMKRFIGLTILIGACESKIEKVLQLQIEKDLPLYGNPFSVPLALPQSPGRAWATLFFYRCSKSTALLLLGLGGIVSASLSALTILFVLSVICVNCYLY